MERANGKSRVLGEVAAFPSSPRFVFVRSLRSRRLFLRAPLTKRVEQAASRRPYKANLSETMGLPC